MFIGMIQFWLNPPLKMNLKAKLIVVNSKDVKSLKNCWKICGPQELSTIVETDLE
jgi:hypothetical protein